MRLHLNMATLLVGCLLAADGLGRIGTLIGVVVILWEIYRCKQIQSLTSDIPAETISDFYRSDRARRYYGAKSTASEILQFAKRADARLH